MSVLSVRLPKDLDRVMPRKDRSAWVVDAIRERLRRERVHEIAKSAAEHEIEELETLADWEPIGAPPSARNRKRGRK